MSYYRSLFKPTKTILGECSQMTMSKMTGIVSEIPASLVKEKKDVAVFTETFRPSRPVHVPVLKPAPKNDDDKNKRRRRLILGMTVSTFLVGITALSFVSLFGEKQDPIEKKVEWVAVHVQQGDTIWDLVREHESNKVMDTRDLIDLVKKHNQLKQVNLQAGMTIEIPVVKSSK